MDTETQRKREKTLWYWHLLLCWITLMSSGSFALWQRDILAGCFMLSVLFFFYVLGAFVAHFFLEEGPRGEHDE